MKRVVVTGAGAVTACGVGVEALVRSLLEGRTAIDEIRSISTENWPVHRGAEIPPEFFEPHFSAQEREKLSKDALMVQLAAREALTSAKLSSGQGVRMDRAAVVLGAIQYFGRAAIVEDVAELAGSKGPRFLVDSACSAGAHSVCAAFDLVRHGIAPIVITGGFNALLAKDVFGLYKLNILTKERIRPFDRLRSGTEMGEGAAVMILEDAEHAAARGAPVEAEMLSYGLGSDCFKIVPPAEDGHGLGLAIKKALAAARIDPFSVDYLNAHGTGTKLNDCSESAAITAAFGTAVRTLPVSSTKPITGHTLGAAGSIEALIAVLALKHRFAPPNLNLENADPECELDLVLGEARKREIRISMSNSSGFGGLYSAITFGRYRGQVAHG